MWTGVKLLAGQLRVCQWLKNLLVLVPLFTSHLILDAETWPVAALAVITFCLASSSGYQINDLLDLGADRKHPVNSRRPLADGRITRRQCGFLAAILALAALTFSVGVSVSFTVGIATYLLASFAYSLFLKRMVVIDLLVIAALFLTRIYAGAIAINVVVSDWLLGFSVFFFLSLAVMKRYISLNNQTSGNPGSQFSYAPEDGPFLLIVGIAATFSSLVLFALYIHDPEIGNRFTAVSWLWGVWVVLIHWTLRIWLLAVRKRVTEDIAAHILRDPLSWFLCGLAFAFFFLAI